MTSLCWGVGKNGLGRTRWVQTYWPGVTHTVRLEGSGLDRVPTIDECEFTGPFHEIREVVRSTRVSPVRSLLDQHDLRTSEFRIQMSRHRNPMIRSIGAPAEDHRATDIRESEKRRSRFRDELGLEHETLTETLRSRRRRKRLPRRIANDLPHETLGRDLRRFSWAVTS